ncbi:16S rRNA (cytosine(967)-C(5))-methyltransferase RsmB [Ectothiorhodospiraceae bacterium 2226]|nr:16S rRNA (cytosine(967)-C(5))-methyltransferase RsmB [Ectothiorhodospiraceae bacterium 2226]
MSGDPRAAAATCLAEVLAQGRSLSAALPPQLAKLAPAQRALAQELAYGTLRYRPRLAPALARLLRRPLKRRDADVEALMLAGLYQLTYMRVPAHAAVAETVSATAALGKDWARGVVNAVLRRYGREQEALLAEVDRDPAARWAHPRWLVQALREAWPQQWEAICAANNAHPPMTLRVNARRGTREDYLARLAAAGIEARPGAHAPEAIVLAAPLGVEALPGFAAGDVSVQDAAAQLAAHVLAPAPGERVLDACAAPGGKTAHLLERCPDIALTAVDVDAERLARLRENLTRLGLEAHLVAGDAADPTWWDGRPYDRILLDAPCSASGVIRRHPDIKTLRRPEDLPALAAQQAKLLEGLWPLLRPGGMLVYATCSVLPVENAEQVARFLAQHPEARPLPLDAAWGAPAGAGRQILPGADSMDGFYYARLCKGGATA